MRAAALAGLAMTVGSLLLAHTSQQSSQTFRSGIDVVRVDVSVLDAQRRPIRGLTANDFTVKVNGQAQPVVALSEIERGRGRAFDSDVVDACLRLFREKGFTLPQ